MTLFRGTLFCLILLSAGVCGQSVSDVVIPTEDEARQAFQSGDIGWDQFLLIQDIIINGLDSTQLYLLDELPNLFYLSGRERPLDDPLEEEQKQRLIEPEQSEPDRARPIQGNISYRHYRFVEDDADEWYRSSADLRLGPFWRIRTAIAREPSGRERWLQRSVTFAGESGPVRQVTVGSFSTRYGLGSLVGYRGKLVEHSDQLGRESFAYPDYGGFNGANVVLTAGSMRIKALGSVARDDHNRLSIFAADYERGGSSHRHGFTVAHTELVDRDSHQGMSYSSLAVHSLVRYGSGQLALEVSRRFGKGVIGGAGLLEGRHRFQTTELRYAAWSYANDYTDLTAGSKAAHRYRSDTLPEVDFIYRSRRRGQSGGMARTTVELSDRFEWSNSLLVASFAPHDNLVEISSILSRKLGRETKLIVSYFGRRSNSPDDSELQLSHRVKGEARFNTRRLRIRCYIGYRFEPEQIDYASLFANARYRVDETTELEIWAKAGEIDDHGLQYGYLFVRGEWQVWQPIRLAAKLSDSFRKSEYDSHTVQFSLEVTARL